MESIKSESKHDGKDTVQDTLSTVESWGIHGALQQSSSEMVSEFNETQALPLCCCIDRLKHCSCAFNATFKNYLIGTTCAMVSILCGIIIPEIGNFTLNQTAYNYPVAFRTIANFFQLPILFSIMTFQHLYLKLNIVDSFKRLGYHGFILGIFFGLGNLFFAETLLLLTPHLGISLGLLEAAMVYALSIFTGRLPFRAAGLALVMASVATILGMCVMKYLTNMDTLGNQQTTVFGVICAILNNVFSAFFDYVIEISSETYKPSQIFADIITQFAMYSLASACILLFVVAVDNFQGFDEIPQNVWLCMIVYAFLDFGVYCSFSFGVYYTNAVFMIFCSLLSVPGSFIVDYFVRGFKISLVEIICSTILLIVISCLQYVIYESQIEQKNTMTGVNDLLSNFDHRQNNIISDSVNNSITPCSLDRKETTISAPVKID